MEALRTVVRIPRNHELRLKLPKHARTNARAEVIVMFGGQEREAEDKKSLMRRAAKDVLFQKDVAEVRDDFSALDADDWHA